MISLAQRLAGEVAEVATQVRSHVAFRSETLALLQRRVGFDIGALQNTRLGATGTGFSLDDDAVGQWLVKCLSEFTPEEFRRISAGRTVDGSDVIQASRRERLTAYRVLGTRTAVATFVKPMRGGYVGFMLARQGSCFGPNDFAMLDAFASVLSVAECLHAVQALDPFTEWSEEIGLTARQREIAGFVARGFRNTEIATLLRCSELTVRNHLAALFRKAGVTNRSELTFCALTHGK